MQLLIILNDHTEQETFAYKVTLTPDEWKSAERAPEDSEAASWLTSIIRDSDRAVELASPWNKRPFIIDGTYVLIVGGTSHEF